MYYTLNLHPKALWNYFEDICKIPRPSKKEEKISEFLMAFAGQHKLEAKKDITGNVLIKKPASQGFEKMQPVVLQSHTDMVCEKNGDITHDFEKDPIEPYVDGEWVKARGTTLGSDDGIGMAAQLAILTSEAIGHGPLECLFTVDEETGLTGASALSEDFMSGKILINLDSEDEGELFIGCAGGRDTTAVFNFDRVDIIPDYTAYKISVSGLKGGHSGDDIDKGLANSNKLLCRFLWNAANNFKLRLNLFDGGNLRNAIPREAYSIVMVPESSVNDFLNFFEKYYSNVKNEYSVTEPQMILKLENTSAPHFLIDEKSQNNLLNALYACPHGVIAMSQTISGLVETSTNLASVKFADINRIIVTTSQRSSVDSARESIAEMVESVFLLADAEVEHSEGYPGWTPDTNSRILNITVNSYRNLFGADPKVRAIHAGLECGLFLKKYPYLDMISFGPSIKGAHSPDERLNIESVNRFWRLLLDVLKSLPVD
jgi:dipeptidase D